MKKTRSPLLCAALALAACKGTPTTSAPRSDASAPAASSSATTSPRVEALLARMTLDEKLGQLTQQPGGWDAPLGPRIDPADRERIRRGQVGSFLSVFGAEFTRELQTIAVEQSRLGIPLLFAFDVIHGFRTTFPVPLAEAASWDPGAVQRAAQIAAREASAAGIHWTFAPMVDVARDPRWGRIVEGSGEDPYLNGVMAAARVRGFQGEKLGAAGTIAACAKHFVAYGAAEGGRDYNTAEVSDRTLDEVYLPPFRAAVDAGVATVMSAFNEIGGVPMTAHRPLLRDVLRGQWGWNGVVVSDWTSIAELIPHGIAGNRADAGRLAITAGVDIDMVSHIYGGELRAEVESGRIPMRLIDEAVRRVLLLKERLGLFEDPYRYSDPAAERRYVLAPEHRVAARAMAQQSMVLLKNDGGVLPLSRQVRRLAVIGPLADDRAAPLGPWSVPGRPEDVVSVLDGLRRALPHADIIHVPGVSLASNQADGLAAAVAAARRADAVLLVLGESAAMSGEAKSRTSLELPGRQEELALAVLAAAGGKPSAVVLMNGRPLALGRLAERAPAILEAWFAGVEAGPAIADILFGAVNPSGKLPVTFPRVSGQIPIYYNHKHTGRAADPAIVWSSKYLDTEISPLFAFGHGLSYTQFTYADLAIAPAQPNARGTVTIELTVKNAGEVDGAEVVQLYVRDPVASVTRPVMELRRFERVPLAAGKSARVRFELPVAELAVRGRDGVARVEPGEIQVMVGASSADVRLRGSFAVTEKGR